MHFVASTVKLVKCLKQGEEDTFPPGHGEAHRGLSGCIEKDVSILLPFDGLNGVAGLPLQSDGLTCEGLHKDLYPMSEMKQV